MRKKHAKSPPAPKAAKRPPARRARGAGANKAGATTLHSPLTTHHSLSSDLVLGIDGGGSHTVALVASAVARDGEQAVEVLGRGVGGPSNHLAVGHDVAVRSIDQAIAAAFDKAGVPRGTVAAACLGLAGADRVADREMFTAWADERRIAARVRIENDASLVLAAGTPDGWGLAVIAGTGSFAVARTADGRTRRSGGWGFLLGDEGSGYAIALAGLRAVARAADERGPATSLTPAFLKRLGLAAPQSLIAAVHSDGMDRAAIAALAGIVTRESAAGDEAARDILLRSSVELSSMAAAAARIFRGTQIGSLPVAFAGGVLTSCDELCDEIALNLLAQGLRPEPVQLVTEPALGAIRLAREDVR